MLFIFAAWLGCKGREDDAARPAPQAAAAELKFDLAPPPDRAPGDLSLTDSLAAVAAGVDAKAKLLDDTSRFASQGKSGGWGDLREATGGDAAVRNWELRFLKGTTKDKYALQLDSFGIELAVVMPDNKLVYVRKFSQKKPETYTGPADQEKRCYLAWQRGDLSIADAELLNRAGVSPGDRVVLKILPAEVEATLARLEKEQAGDNPGDVTKTQFGIRPAGGKFEFYVTDQFRKERASK
jgi:hypothetical protein